MHNNDLLNNDFEVRLVDIKKDWIDLCDCDAQATTYRYWTQTPGEYIVNLFGKKIQNDKVYTVGDDGEYRLNYTGFSGQKKGQNQSKYNGYGVRPVIEFKKQLFDEDQFGSTISIGNNNFIIFSNNKAILDGILPQFSCFSMSGIDYETSAVKTIVDQFKESMLSQNLTEAWVQQEYKILKDRLVELFNQNGWQKLTFSENMPFDVIIKPMCHKGITPTCEEDCYEFQLFAMTKDGVITKLPNTGGRTLDRIAKQLLDIVNTVDNNPITMMVDLVGVTFRGVRDENVQENISTCHLGDPVKLTRVAGNLRNYINQGAGADETAVEVRTVKDDKALGFIPATQNERIARKLMKHANYKASVADVRGGQINRKTGKPYNYGVTVYIEFFE